MRATIQSPGLRGLPAILIMMAVSLKLGAEPAPTILFDAPFMVEAPISCEAITAPPTTTGPRPVWQCHFPTGQWEAGIAQYQQAAEQARAERDQARAEITALQQALHAARQKPPSAAIHASLVELRQRLHATQSELQDARKALADKQRALDGLRSGSEEKSTRITSLSSELGDCQTRLAALSSERDALKEQLAALENRVQNAKQRALADTSSLNQTMQQVDALKAELHAKQQQYAALHAISNEQAARAESAEKQLAALREQLRDKQASQASLTSELNKARTAQNALAHDKAALQQQQNETREALRQARDALAQYRQTSQQALNEKQARISACEAQRRSQQAERTRLMSALETRLAACSTRLTELPKLKQRIASLQNQLSDSDEDGISDADDRCAGTPAGHPVDSSGCEPDRDQDGTPDIADLCPDDAASDTRIPGCPDDAPIRLSGVQFHFNSDRMKPESEARLQQVIDTLNAHPDVAMEIAGHTDSIGKAAYNQRLSLKRAEKVRDYLVEHGIAAERLQAKGYGESQPTSDNNSDAGRAENRRVELRVLPADTP